jgi:triosephosphate isomerase
MLKKRIVGNWKMNGLKSDLAHIIEISQQAAAYPMADVAICVPATLIESAAKASDKMAIGAQDCHASHSGAHTGCVSAAMVAECGAKYVIVGHSERRTDQGESNADVKAKAQAVIAQQMCAILCVGESEDHRNSGNAVAIVIEQLNLSLPDINNLENSLCVAYEPIWAIGTGRIPSLDEVAEMHMAIRQALVVKYGENGNDIHILYGGSMNGDNAADLLNIAHVDGGLVGGASLNAAKFTPVIEAANNA